MRKATILIFYIVLAINTNGQSWVSQTSGTTQNLNCVFFIGNDTGYAGGNGIVNGTLLKTVNGGLTWNTISFPSAYNLRSIYFTSKDTGYILSENTQLYKTVNGGTSWTYLRSLGYYGTANAAFNGKIFFQNSMIGFVRSYWDAYMFRTLNGGASWDSVPLANNCGGCPSMINFISSSIGFTRSNTSSIYKTNNAGATWSLLSTPTTNSLSDVKFLNSNLGFVVGNLSNNILKTIDGGSTWNVVPVGMTVGTSNKLIFTSTNKAFMLNSTTNYFTVSNDSCNTWTAMGIYPNSGSFNDFFMVNDSIGYAVGNSGSIYKTYPGAIAPPTTASSSLYTSSITNTSMTVNWTNGNGARRIVITRAGSSSMTNPINGTTYTANPIFGSGNTVGAGNYVVYDGTGSSCNVAGLSLSTTYFFRVYEYNGLGTTSSFLTNSYASVGAATLPVNWLGFSAELKSENSVKLNWSTASEINNNYFEIERSTDNSNWTLVNKVKGNRNSNLISKYNFIDILTNPSANDFYYRLKQVDFDGKIGYSRTVTVSLISPQTNNFYTFYPNPNNGQFKIDFYGNHETKIIRLLDKLGKVVKEITTTDSMTFIEENQLDKGIYLINIQSNDNNFYSKIVIN